MQIINLSGFKSTFHRCFLLASANKVIRSRSLSVVMRFSLLVITILSKIVSSTAKPSESSQNKYALRPRQVGGPSTSSLSTSSGGSSSSMTSTAAGPGPPPKSDGTVPYPFAYPFAQPNPYGGVWNTTTKASLYRDTMYVVHPFKGWVTRDVTGNRSIPNCGLWVLQDNDRSASFFVAANPGGDYTAHQLSVRERHFAYRQRTPGIGLFEMNVTRIHEALENSRAVRVRRPVRGRRSQ